MPSRGGMWGLLAGLGLVAAVVAACGGGSSSSSGPSSGGGGGGTSGAVVQGQLRSRTAASGESVVVVAFERVLGVGVAEAAVGPLAGVTVRLIEQGNPLNVLTTTTDANGNFLFTHVPTGIYQVVVVGYTLSPNPTLITVDIGDKGIVDGVVNGDTIQLTAAVTVNDINDFLQNPVQLCKAITVARLTGANLQQIINERLSGKGWGRIVQDHGGRPSMLGVPGNCSDAEIATASSLGNGHGKPKGKSNGKKKG